MYLQIDPSAKFQILTITTLLIGFVALCLIMFIIFYRQRQNHFIQEKELMQSQFDQLLLKSQVEVQESTMAVLSKELHDNVGQLLSTSKMLLGLTERNLTDPPETLITANETVGQAINEIRSLSKALDSDWLKKFDLLKNLATEIKRFGERSSVKIHFFHPETIPLKADQQIILFRIMQEAIQNSVKHAQPKNIYIILSVTEQTLVAAIRDDGKGMTKTDITDGMGKMNMQQRAKLLGGQISWKNLDKGCEVTFKMPFID